MKTSEFIKRVEDLGYLVTKQTTRYVIEKSVSEELENYVADVDLRYRNTIRTNSVENDELLDLIVEYARTPLEERKEPKRYYIRPKGMIILGGASFSYNPYGEYWYLENDPSTDHMTTFTIKELEDLGIDIEHYDLEEVEWKQVNL